MNEVPVFKFALREDLKDQKQFLPTRAEPHATGWDVRAAQADRKQLVFKPFQKAKINLGFRGFCPPGWWYQLVPRSSTFGKKSLHCLYGTVDETFEGELVFACQYIPEIEIFSDDLRDGTLIAENSINNINLIINFGEAIGQIIPVKRQEMFVEVISNEEYNSIAQSRNAVRKDGGFGSTDSK